jgi:hypothetical protein
MTSLQINAIISLIPTLETHELGLLIAQLSSTTGSLSSHTFDAMVSLCKTIDDKQKEQVLLSCIDKLKTTTQQVNNHICHCKHKDTTFGTYS